MEKQMSSSKKVKYDMTPYNDYLNYLKNYDTSNVDTTLSNLTSWASNASQNLGDLMGDYTFNVEASDAAREAAQNAVYNQYMDRLTPQFEQQTDDLQTRLANQGLSVGSEAYQRAMTDLLQEQNDATNQAAFQSVLAGQDAYTQDLNNQLAAAGFGNTAQQAYINQLLSALSGSASGYENQQNIFSVGTGKSNLQYQQDKANASGGLSGALSGALTGAIQGFATTGNPWGAVAGGAMGAYSGYNRNPYA